MKEFRLNFIITPAFLILFFAQAANAAEKVKSELPTLPSIIQNIKSSTDAHLKVCHGEMFKSCLKLYKTNNSAFVIKENSPNVFDNKNPQPQSISKKFFEKKLDEAESIFSKAKNQKPSPLCRAKIDVTFKVMQNETQFFVCESDLGKKKQEDFYKWYAKSLKGDSD